MTEWSKVTFCKNVRRNPHGSSNLSMVTKKSAINYRFSMRYSCCNRSRLKNKFRKLTGESGIVGEMYHTVNVAPQAQGVRIPPLPQIIQTFRYVFLLIVQVNRNNLLKTILVTEELCTCSLVVDGRRLLIFRGEIPIVSSNLTVYANKIEAKSE